MFSKTVLFSEKYFFTSNLLIGMDHQWYHSTYHGKRRESVDISALSKMSGNGISDLKAMSIFRIFSWMHSL